MGHEKHEHEKHKLHLAVCFDVLIERGRLSCTSTNRNHQIICALEVYVV